MDEIDSKLFKIVDRIETDIGEGSEPDTMNYIRQIKELFPIHGFCRDCKSYNPSVPKINFSKENDKCRGIHPIGMVGCSFFKLK
jgi:hypothetical protein